MELKEFLVSDLKYCVKILRSEKDFFELLVNDKNVLVRVVKFDLVQNIFYLQINGQFHKMHVCKENVDHSIVVNIMNLCEKIVLHDKAKCCKDSGLSKTEAQHADMQAKFYGAESLSLKSPLAGRITKVFVKHGDWVIKNNPILLIESMKMENEIRVPCDAFVKNILISEGNLIQQNQVLVTFEKKGESDVPKPCRQEVLQG